MGDASDASHHQEALIRRARQGESNALESLLGACRAELARYVVSRIGEHLRPSVDPDDVIQETCARALDSMDRVVWTGNDTFVRWLKGIARHVILQQARRHGRDALIHVEYRAPGTGEPSPSRALGREERFHRLRKAVDRLPADYREAVLLVRIEGLSIRQAAERMNRSPKSITHLLSRGLKKLKDDLGDTESLSLPPRRFETEGRDDD